MYVSLPTFQFHKGTIKAITLSFESFSYSDFNSIKVQLKLRWPPCASPSPPQFQFHKGTIKAQVLRPYARVYEYFNSIKVQLKPASAASGVLGFHYFNSIKVQLKLCLDVEEQAVLFHFNSIKVQLKLDTELKIFLINALFQFHKGTIKAQKVYNDFYRFSQISIP